MKTPSSGSRFVRAVLTGALLVNCGCTGGTDGKSEPARAAISPSGPRGIVLVTIDGWWDPKTKADSIPAEVVPKAVRLSDAMTICPQVRPAICSILTGKSPVETGVLDDLATPLPADVPLVSETLKAKGWRTAAFVADPRIGNGSGLERGFEIFDPPKEFLFGPFRHLPNVRNPGDVVSDFSTWAAALPEDGSFFAWVHLSRPMLDAPKGAKPADLSGALEQLSKTLAGAPRLAKASVLLAGIAGKIDIDDGERSGYFLNADVIRVPVLVRSGTGASLDAARPFVLSDVAGWVLAEAGAGAAPAAAKGHEPRLAWTWRGRNDFGWPSETAAQAGTALCVRAEGLPTDRCESWAAGPALEEDRRACAAALGAAPRSNAASRGVPSLPAELAKKVKALGLAVPTPKSGKTTPPAHSVLAGLIPSITKARRLADHAAAADADDVYGTVLKADPDNFGVLLEGGGVLALRNRVKRARARLEPAIRAVPWNSEVWHWFGHVWYAEKDLERAETMWLVSDELGPRNGDVLYDLACARSLAGDPSKSEAYLRQAWEAGYRDVDKIQQDTDLRNLRADPAFARFMREVVH